MDALFVTIRSERKSLIYVMFDCVESHQKPDTSLSPADDCRLCSTSKHRKFESCSLDRHSGSLGLSAEHGQRSAVESPGIYLPSCGYCILALMAHDHAMTIRTRLRFAKFSQRGAAFGRFSKSARGCARIIRQPMYRRPTYLTTSPTRRRTQGAGE